MTGEDKRRADKEHSGPIFGDWKVVFEAFLQVKAPPKDGLMLERHLLFISGEKGVECLQASM